MAPQALAVLTSACSPAASLAPHFLGIFAIATPWPVILSILSAASAPSLCSVLSLSGALLPIFKDSA